MPLGAESQHAVACGCTVVFAVICVSTNLLLRGVGTQRVRRRRRAKITSGESGIASGKVMDHRRIVGEIYFLSSSVGYFAYVNDFNSRFAFLRKRESDGYLTD